MLRPYSEMNMHQNRWIVSTALIVFALSCTAKAPPAGTTLHFTDVTKAAGIRFKHTNGAAGRYYYVETYGPGGAFFDYDGDGDLDVYLVNGADLPGHTSPEPPTGRLYRNEGERRKAKGEKGKGRTRVRVSQRRK